MKVRRGVKGGSKTTKVLSDHDWKEIMCDNNCGRIVRVEEGIEKAICGVCACILAGPTPNMIRDEERRKAKESGVATVKRPRGWQFMKEFVDAEKNVFHQGIEMPELKGTLEPTVIVKKPKLSKRERDERKQKKLQKRFKQIEKKKAEAENSKKFFKEEVAHE